MTNRSRLVLISLVILSASSVLTAQSQSSQPAVRGQNAAIKYLRADASLRQSYPLPTDAWLKLEEALKRPLDSEDQKLVDSAVEALTEFEHATHIGNCDWDVSVEDGPFANTSHRGVIRELVALSQLRARIRFRDGQKKGAIEDILAGYTAARHLSLDGSIASVLFGYKVEQEVSSVLEQGLSLLSPAELDQLETGLAKLPQSSSMRSAIDSEKLSRNDLLEIVRSAVNRDDLIRRMLTGIPFLNNDRRKAEEVVDGCGGSGAGVIDCIGKQSAFYSKWASNFGLNPEQFQKAYDTDFAQASFGNPVITLLTPSLPRFRWAEAYNETRRRLVQAAVAVQREGAKQLTHYPDPYDGRSFSYSPLGSGFKLESSLRENGKPLSISVYPPSEAGSNQISSH